MLKIYVKKRTLFVILGLFIALGAIFLIVNANMNQISSTSPDGGTIVRVLPFEATDSSHPLNGNLRIYVERNSSPISVSVIRDQTIQTKIPFSSDLQIQWHGKKKVFSIDKSDIEVFRFEVKETRTECLSGCEQITDNPYK